MLLFYLFIYLFIYFNAKKSVMLLDAIREVRSMLPWLVQVKNAWLIYLFIYLSIYLFIHFFL